MSDHEVSALTITRYVTATTEAVYAGTIVWCLEQVAQIACSCHSMARDLAMLASLYTFTLTMRAASQECCMTARNMQPGLYLGEHSYAQQTQKVLPAPPKILSQTAVHCPTELAGVHDCC